MATTSIERLLSELNHKTKTTNKELCCIKDALTANASTIDYETNVAYNPLTNEIVIVSFGYDQSGTLSVVNTNVDGTPYTGPTPVKGAKDFELSTKEWFCLNNTDTISRVDIFIDGILTTSIWQSLTGTIIPAPVSGTYTVGVCETSSTLNTVNPVDFNAFDVPSTTILSEFYNSTGSERTYTDKVRIISDYNDIHRVESVNKTTEILDCCFQVNFVGPSLRGYLVITKNHLGEPISQYIVNRDSNISPSQAVANANLVDCQGNDYVLYTDLKTKLDCYVQFDNNPISGFSLFNNGYLYEKTQYTQSSLTITKTVTTNDSKTVITDDVMHVDCPELVCLNQNGVNFKGYSILLKAGTAVNGTGPVSDITVYFDENKQPLDNSINPVTVVDCDSNIYNNVNHFLIDDTTHLTINANTAHSIYYNILQGTVDVTIDTTTLPYIQGESGTDIATNLINQEYTFTPKTGGLVKVRVIN